MNQWFLVFLADIFLRFLGAVFGNAEAYQLFAAINQFNNIALFKIRQNVYQTHRQ